MRKTIFRPSRFTSFSKFDRTDLPLIGILASDLFMFFGGSAIHLTIVWWVLAQGTSPSLVAIMTLAIIIPLNIGALLSGMLVARLGARRLLLWSKSIACAGALVCLFLLLANALSLVTVACVAVVTYGAMGPSTSADLSRVPSLCRLSGWRIISFHSTNSIIILFAHLGGLGLAGLLVDHAGTVTAVISGSVFCFASLATTAFTFPRDRDAIMKASRSRHPVDLIGQVLRHPHLGRLGRMSLIVVAGLAGIAAAMRDVTIPLATRAAGDSASLLSLGTGLCIIGSVAGALLARRLDHGLEPGQLARGGALTMTLALGSAAWFGGWWAILAATVLITTTAALSTTIVTARLQEQLPASLQAQTMGVWQSLVLSLNTVIALVTGGLAALSLSTSLAVLAVLCLLTACMLLTRIR